jgi:sigma-54 dependent transcriptional regulator, acetoin dehydrogenase operon transcriptional activator AcoR
MMLSTNKSQDRGRLVLDQQGTLSAESLTPDIYDSWMRCISFGLDTRHPPPPEVVSLAVLRKEQERYSLTRGLALAEMHSLHQQIAGSNFMIAFASPEGVLLDFVSDRSFDDTSGAAGIRPGAIWTEEYCGTNGLGTAAHLKRQIVVHGGEHFFSRYNNLTCTASPIFAPDGSLAGVLDASSNCLSRQTHTQALVGMAATQIENGLFREKNRGNMLIAIHNRTEYLHTISAGLLAVNKQGEILAANRAARNMLHGLPISPGKQFSDVFRTRFSTFVDEGRRHERQNLHDDVGSRFVATIENAREFPMAQPVSKARIAHPPAVATQFISADPVTAQIVRQVHLAALRKMPVLIRGETGTGKEQLARHAHVASGRKGSFVAVNCAALPESLIEAELFGYAEGSFTGARKGGSIGLFREADGGTLFLDEIGDMPVALQAVLLRFLDDWTIRPVGGAARVLDVLLVSATNCDLDEAISKGRFRSDLLFRLNILEVTLQPLRDRSDFGDIARHLLKVIDPTISITQSAIDRLAELEWQGNIRELRNAMSRLSLNEDRSLIDEAAVNFMLGQSRNGNSYRNRTATEKSDSVHLKDNLHDLQLAQVLAVYAETGKNISKTARKLGVSRNMIYRTLRDQQK